MVGEEDWIDFENAVNETLDVLFKGRFDGISGEETKKLYETLNEAWYYLESKGARDAFCD